MIIFIIVLFITYIISLLYLINFFIIIFMFNCCLSSAPHPHPPETQTTGLFPHFPHPLGGPGFSQKHQKHVGYCNRDLVHAWYYYKDWSVQGIITKTWFVQGIVTEIMWY